MILTGVMLGVVLFALSAGYWRGGMLSSRWDSSRIRTALVRNLLLAGAFYAAISFPAEAALLEKLMDAGLNLAFGIGVAATLLFVLPVYLASQTVPMLAELVGTDGKAGKASGRVLFFSTLGSVAGGVITPVVLFPSFGVRISTYIICVMLAVASLVMAAGHIRPSRIAPAAAAVLAAVSLGRFLSPSTADRYAFDSANQSIRITEEKAPNGRVERVMHLNGGRASGIYVDNGESSFSYIREADLALQRVRSPQVLVIGAAGFTFPRDAAALPYVTRIDAVDVDPVVLPVAERHFLFARLSSKIRFFPSSARYALRRFQREARRYGFALLDAYSGKGIPDELLTVEFFSGVRSVSDHVAANVIMDRDVTSAFAQNLLASFKSVFAEVWIKDVSPGGDSDTTNFLVTNWEIPGAKAWNGKGVIYTDDRNTADRDHVDMIWGDD